MNPSPCSDVLSKTAQGTAHRGRPPADNLRQDPRFKEQIPPWDPVGPSAPGEPAMDTFVDGAGI
jgi:hypothetical protein